jgi:imidazolonepropionase-like amidohydrolase
VHKKVFSRARGLWLTLICCGLQAAPGTASAAAASAAAAPAPVSAIRAGKLIDVSTGRVLANQIIVIRGTKIEAVGANVAIPDGAKVMDLSKMTVLPGLIDCHTHLADLADAEPLNVLQRSAAETAYLAIPNASVTLLAGFTTVRDVGVYRAFNDVAMRDAIAKGIIIGPRMYVAGAYVTITGGAGAMTGLPPDIQLPLDLRFGVGRQPVGSAAEDP